MGIQRKGIDISYCQPNFDYAKAKANGVEFCIIRVGVKDHIDTLCKQHIAGCEKVGLPYGFYWYSTHTSWVEIMEEAQVCKNILDELGVRPAYPVFLDVEEVSQAQAMPKERYTDAIIDFIHYLESAGYPSGLYCNPSWLEQYLIKDRLVNNVDIWLAHWTQSPNVPTKYNYGQVIWQWGLDKTTERSEGIDGDICYIDYPAKTSLWYSSRGISTDKNKEDKVEPSNNGTVDIIKPKRGEKVIVHEANLYGSSDASKAVNTVDGTFYIYRDGVFGKGRVAITTEPGNPDCTGWVDIGAIENGSVSMDLHDWKAGEKVLLTKASLYGSSDSEYPVRILDGQYYVYRDGIFNNRIAVTTTKGNKDATGWVSLLNVTKIEG